MLNPEAPKIFLEDKDCPLGCIRDDEVVLTGKDRLYGFPGEFTVVRCRKCGLMRTNPRPLKEAMSFYYSDDYHPYSFTAANNEDLGHRRRPPLKKKIGKQLFKFNVVSLPPQNPGKMLEIGCGTGQFLHHIAKQGWEAEGIELSEKAAQWARQKGLRVWTGRVESFCPPSENYDLIVGWMVLEHLYEPVVALRNLYSWAKEGGWLALSLPNAAAIDFRLFRANWYALQLPAHLYHFTPKTLKRILDKSGWSVKLIFHQRVMSNFLASLGLWLFQLGIFRNSSKKLVKLAQQGGIINYLLYPLASLLAVFKSTGRMTVWARKEND